MWTDADRETYQDVGQRDPSDLTDAQWATIAPLLSGYDPLTADLRETVDACLYLERTDCSGRYLPTDFGPRPTVRTWYDPFRADGPRSEIAALLTRAVRQKRGRACPPGRRWRLRASGRIVQSDQFGAGKPVRVVALAAANRTGRLDWAIMTRGGTYLRTGEYGRPAAERGALFRVTRTMRVDGEPVRPGAGTPGLMSMAS